MELDAEPIVSQEYIDQAIRLGIDFGDKPVDAHVYTVAFFQKLLLLREKIDQGFLNEYISPHVIDKWKKFLGSMEEESRKLLAITNGSVVFTLFCPTKNSFLQTHNKTWKKKTTENFNEMLRTIGKVAIYSHICILILLKFHSKW